MPDAAADPRSFIVQASPHLGDGQSVRALMWTVCAALAPAWAIALYNYRLLALLPLAHTVGAAVLAEALWQRLARRPLTIGDGSAALTGLLLAMNLPPGAPWWLCWIGGLFAIVVAKQVFGGLGHNVFNPALAARVFLLISFPVQMTRWVVPAVAGAAGSWLWPAGADVVTGASPLGLLKERGPEALAVPLEVLYGGIGALGSLGEMSDLALIAGGLFLLWRRVITWHTPLAFIGTVALFAALTHQLDPGRFASPLFHLGAGGLMLGAWFMATDYVTTPVYPAGRLLFGVGCGVLTMVIRLWGGYPEGVAFSILLMNSITPLIERATKPAGYGEARAGLARLLPWRR